MRSLTVGIDMGSFIHSYDTIILLENHLQVIR